MFSELALHERLLRALAELNFTEPTPVQAAAIPAAIEGRDLRVIARTGSGKTAAFVLPLLNRFIGEAKPRVAIRSLILLPTRELARQTLAEVERFSRFTFLQSGVITGGEDFREQGALLRKDPDVLIATPGRLIEHLNAGHLKLDQVEVLILDEADRMLDMGFAEDMERLVAECSSRQQTLLFSATTGGNALREMVNTVLNDPLHLMINQITELNESTRQQIITADDVPHKERLVHWLLTNEPFRKALVFTNTRVQADRLYGRLVAQDINAFVLHGDKDQKDRKRALELFSQGSSRVLVATDVAARGLDIDGLDLVVNFDMPRSGDEYLHRIGRSGRAGEEGLAISLICHNDWNLMSSVERYLKQTFERRVIKELKGAYQGPKNVKASGKAAGSKKKKAAKKGAAKSAAKSTKRSSRGRQPEGTFVVSSDGHAPLRKK